jgi:hypothetical protein
MALSREAVSLRNDRRLRLSKDPVKTEEFRRLRSAIGSAPLPKAAGSARGMRAWSLLEGLRVEGG